MAKLRVAQELIDFFYPVGCIYTSMNSTNPQTLFGGTWVQITNRFLYCTSYSKTYGGQNSVSYTPSGSINGHTLTIDEIPGHTHNVTYNGWTNAQTGSGIGYSNLAGTMNTKTSSSTGGGKSHNHTFTGTAATIPTVPEWISCYAWYRTA